MGYYDSKGQGDKEDAHIVRLKYAPLGWAYQAHFVQITSSKIGSAVCRDQNNNPINFVSMKFYKADGTEITTGLQADLDLHCVKTVVIWEPDHSIEVISGSVMNYERPLQDIYLSAVVAPHIPASSGGTKVFVNNLNLKYVPVGTLLRTDGRASKHIAYDATYFSHRWHFNLYHPTGFQHELQLLVEFYKA